MYNVVYRTVLISLIALIGACSKVDSNDLRSSGFYANMYLDANGDNSTRVMVCLSTSSAILADTIRLSPGDNLTATANNITKPLIDGACYENSFGFDDGGTEFVISLDRAGDDSMPNSNVTLPEKYEILMPSKDEEFNAGDTITVTWSPVVSGGKIDVSYSGDCIDNNGVEIHFGRSYIVQDTGIHSVQVNDVLNVFGDHASFNKSIPCDSYIELERTNIGTLDPNYGKGGSIKATQARKVDIIINP